jgi:hypothetical protein
MTSAGFEPAIPAIERQQTYALDNMATGISYLGQYHLQFLHRYDAKCVNSLMAYFDRAVS